MNKQFLKVGILFPFLSNFIHKTRFVVFLVVFNKNDAIAVKISMGNTKNKKKMGKFLTDWRS